MQTPQTLIDLGNGLRFTESPRWRRDRLWFIDIHDNAIKSVSLTGDLRTELTLPFKPNGLGFTPDGSAVFSDALNLAMKRWDGGALHDLASLDGTAVFCLSDAISRAAYDRKGRLDRRRSRDPRGRGLRGGTRGRHCAARPRNHRRLCL